MGVGIIERIYHRLRYGHWFTYHIVNWDYNGEYYDGCARCKDLTPSK